jgi:LacI family transcriptional regulator
MMILPERPTALVVGSGELSFGVVEALKEMRVRMPRELSLVVYGDPEWGKLCTPPLTTIAVSYSALAQAAAEQMVGMLAAGEARRLNPSVPTFTLIPVQLIVRGSTAGPVQRGASCA